MRWRAAWGLVLALAAAAAPAQMPEEDEAYVEAYRACQQQHVLAGPGERRPVTDVALEYVDGDPRGIRFHAYSGCKDALERNPMRTVIAAAEAQYAAAPGQRDGRRFQVPGLGEYTWVFFADLLLGATIGAWSWRRKGSSGLAGAATGMLIGFMCFGAAFTVAILTMFLFPSITPFAVFLLTAPLTALFAYGRPDGSGAGMLLP